MSKQFESIKERYLTNWVTDVQLDKYVEMKVITEKEARQIKREKGTRDSAN